MKPVGSLQCIVHAEGCDIMYQPPYLAELGLGKLLTMYPSCSCSLVITSTRRQSTTQEHHCLPVGVAAQR